MVICETTVRPMAALWHPCHRGIRESIHIRRGGRASKDGLAARRGANAIAQNDEQPPCPNISLIKVFYIANFEANRFERYC